MAGGNYGVEIAKCPYFMTASKTAVYCEGGTRICFPTAKERVSFINNRCALIDYRNCEIARQRNIYYEREMENEHTEKITDEEEA